MACADSPLMGSIDLWPLNWAPLNWMFCQGQTLAISQYSALFSLIGTTFGGNGTSNFQLPNLQSRVVYGAAISTTQQDIGVLGGASQVSLNISNLPAHNHTATLAQSSQFTGNVSLPVKTGLGQGTSNPQGAYLGPGANIYFTSPTSGSTLGAAPVTVTAQSGAPVTVGLTGSNVPVSTMPPYLTLNYIICIYGIYPTRP
jgi:microcystin-dependent protein